MSQHLLPAMPDAAGAAVPKASTPARRSDEVERPDGHEFDRALRQAASRAEPRRRADDVAKANEADGDLASGPTDVPDAPEASTRSKSK